MDNKLVRKILSQIFIFLFYDLFFKGKSAKRKAFGSDEHEKKTSNRDRRVAQSHPRSRETRLQEPRRVPSRYKLR